MVMLASDFSGVEIFLGAGLCLILMAAFSYIGSVRGHWSGPLLASPLLLGVIAYLGMELRNATEPQGLVWTLSIMSPLLLLSGGSVAVWMIRRKAAEQDVRNGRQK